MARKVVKKKIRKKKINLRLVDCCEICKNIDSSEEYYFHCEELGKVFGDTEKTVCNLFGLDDYYYYSKSSDRKETEQKWREEGFI